MYGLLMTVQIHLRRRALEVYRDQGLDAFVDFCAQWGMVLE
jgi:hypothetical protein